MKGDGLLGRIVIAAVIVLQTMWAFSIDPAPKPGLPVMAQRFLVAIMVWGIGGALWYRLFVWRGAARPAESAAYRAARILEQERREGRISTPTGRVSSESESLQRLRTPTGKG